MRRTLSSQSFSSVQKELHFGHQVNSTVQIQAGTPTITAAGQRLRREVGRVVAEGRIQGDLGPGDDAPTFTREGLAEAWGIRE